jgi:hypothetical protein
MTVGIILCRSKTVRCGELLEVLIGGPADKCPSMTTEHITDLGKAILDRAHHQRSTPERRIPDAVYGLAPVV